MIENVKAFLDAKVLQYNQPAFIPNDPVSIPHLFTKRQDIEIMGLWAAVLAWGQRVTIINKCHELIALMDGAPYDFIMNHEETDLKKLLHFKHRTFNDVDTLYFISFFKHHYTRYGSLEAAFLPGSGCYGELVEPKRGKVHSAHPSTGLRMTPSAADKNCHGELAETKAGNFATEPIEIALNHFRAYFLSLVDFPDRTKKHISSPSQKSTCKRLNMFLRWMVRDDHNGVDFGIWKQISQASLIMPCDLHVDRVARKLNLITRKQTDWQTAIELTGRLREFDPTDPVKYDFALFGLGIEEKF